MRRKPMKVFTAAVFIISLLLLALCFYKEQEPKAPAAFIALRPLWERMRCIERQ